MLIRDLDHMLWRWMGGSHVKLGQRASAVMPTGKRPRDRIVMTGWFIRPLVALFRDHDTGERDSTTI